MTRDEQREVEARLNPPPRSKVHGKDDADFDSVESIQKIKAYQRGATELRDEIIRLRQEHERTCCENATTIAALILERDSLSDATAPLLEAVRAWYVARKPEPRPLDMCGMDRGVQAEYEAARRLNFACQKMWGEFAFSDE